MRSGEIVDALRAVPLFASLNQRQLRRLASLCTEREYRPGGAVVREGQMSGVGFFVVAEGEASVDVAGDAVATLGPGAHFGELALITRHVRTASVTARTPLRCLVISFWDFRKFAEQNPDILWSLLEHVTDLLAVERERRSRAALGAS